MTLHDLNDLGGFVGGVGVLATLAYGLIEYRRLRVEAQRTAAFQAEMSFSEFNLAIAQDPALASLVARYHRPDAQIADFTEESWRG